jgi:mannitol-1-phosphate/altronate dehydrogenase
MRWSGSRTLADVSTVTLREEADRARFYAQMLLHRFRDPVTAERLRAVAADLERQAAARVAAQRNRRTT